MMRHLALAAVCLASSLAGAGCLAVGQTTASGLDDTFASLAEVARECAPDVAQGLGTPVVGTKLSDGYVAQGWDTATFTPLVTVAMDGDAPSPGSASDALDGTCVEWLDAPVDDTAGRQIVARGDAEDGTIEIVVKWDDPALNGANAPDFPRYELWVSTTEPVTVPQSVHEEWSSSHSDDIGLAP